MDKLFFLTKFGQVISLKWLLFLCYIFIYKLFCPPQMSAIHLLEIFMDANFREEAFCGGHLLYAWKTRLLSEDLTRSAQPSGGGGCRWWSGPKYGGFCRLGLLTKKCWTHGRGSTSTPCGGPRAETPQFQRLKLTPQSFGILAKTFLADFKLHWVSKKYLIELRTCRWWWQGEHYYVVSAWLGRNSWTRQQL